MSCLDVDPAERLWRRSRCLRRVDFPPPDPPQDHEDLAPRDLEGNAVQDDGIAIAGAEAPPRG